VRRHQLDAGKKLRENAKKQFVTQKMKQQSLEWTKNSIQYWTVDVWKKYFFLMKCIFRSKEAQQAYQDQEGRAVKSC